MQGTDWTALSKGATVEQLMAACRAAGLDAPVRLYRLSYGAATDLRLTGHPLNAYDLQRMGSVIQ